VLVSRAVVRHELGRLSGAQDDLDRATPLVGPECAAEVVLQQAALHQNIGRLWAAARLYREVLERPTCPPDVRVKATNNLALLEVGLGRWDAALAHVEQAVRLAADLGPAPHAIVTQSRAWVTMQVGRLPESLRRFEEAGVLYERAGLPLAEHYIEYADALVELRLLPEAQVVADRAAAELRRWSARLMAPEAELRAARLHLLAGRGEPALAAARAAAAQLRRQGRTAWAARADLTAVEAQALLGRLPAAALRRLREATTTLERLGLCSDAVEGHLAAGRLSLEHGRRDEALTSLARADRLSRRAPVLVRLRGRVAAALAGPGVGRPGDGAAPLPGRPGGPGEHSAALPSMELRALASGHGAELGRLGLRAVLPAGRPARVLDWMDRTRAAALVPVDAPPTAGLEDELAALRTVQAELEEARRCGQEPVQLVSRVAAAEHRVRRASWRGEACRAGRHGQGPPAELRAALGRPVLVVYGSLDGQLTAAVLSPGAPGWWRWAAPPRSRRTPTRCSSGCAGSPALAHRPQPGQPGRASRRPGPAWSTCSSVRSAPDLTSRWSSCRAPSCRPCPGRRCTRHRRRWRPPRPCGCARPAPWPRAPG
jgi:tetratricopeptide (TPR) repeat protein